MLDMLNLMKDMTILVEDFQQLLQQSVPQVEQMKNVSHALLAASQQLLKLAEKVTSVQQNSI